MYWTWGTATACCIGDNGNATFDAAGTLRFITTSDPDIGGVDTIKAGNGGNVVLGGDDDDTITTGAHDDVIVGDNGNAKFDATGTLRFITTSDPDIGGVDTIEAGDGENVVLGGNDDDTITTGAHDDVIVGDNGNATFDAAGTLTFVTTSNPDIGGVDTIDAGDGENVVLGGNDDDTITTGANDDVIVGDNGNATFSEAGTLTFVTNHRSRDRRCGQDCGGRR